MARFKIPINEYYQKSREIKDKTEQTVQEFENKFVNFISSNSSGVDNQDLDKLMSSSSYDKAKKNLNKLETEDLINLEKMAQEGSNNPIDKLLELDQKYADEFQKIAQGNFGDELSRKINAIETKVQALQGKHEIKAFISQLKGMVDSETFNTLMKLADVDKYLSLFEKLMEIDKFTDSLIKYPKIAEGYYSLFELMLKVEDFTNKKYIEKMNKLANNEKFIKFMDRMPTPIVDKTLEIMTEKFPRNLLNGMKSVLIKIKNIVKTDVWFFVESEFKSKTGKLLGKCAKVAPYADVTVSGATNIAKDIMKYKDIEKGVIGGSLETVAHIDAIDSTFIGASIGGIIGAGIGFLIGNGI